jgi:hypothetical protein
MRTSTAKELKEFMAGVPDDFQVWGLRGDIYAAPPDAREKFIAFPGMQPDTDEMQEKMRQEMHRIAVSDHDCPV